MEIRQLSLRHLRDVDLTPLVELSPDLVLVFGAVELLAAEGLHASLSTTFPGAALLGCSTAGEISGNGVADGSIVLTALRFARVRHRVAEARLEVMAGSHAAGVTLGRALAAPDLAGVLLFSPGVGVNGSALVQGVTEVLGSNTPISGGLAGDGGAFRSTLTVCPSGVLADQIVALGLYGPELRLSHGSFGGWVPFGPARRVTRAEGNVLYELDDRPALELYRAYLGDYAKDLPASGLLFPFEMLDAERAPLGLIRTILGIDDAAGSLTLAGDIEVGGHLRLMHAGTDELIDGATIAAERLCSGLSGAPGPGLALLVSCVGRKLVMGDAVEEEVEAVLEVLGASGVVPTGFYSYGEIAPFEVGTGCRLHNQTMTVTFLGEA